jgi:hypothetical protein
VKKILTIPGYNEMQIKTTLRFHLTPVRMVTIKNTKNISNAGEDAGKKQRSYNVVGNVR